MDSVEDIIQKTRAQFSFNADRNPYREYALQQIAEKGYFTAGGKENMRFETPFIVTLHPGPTAYDAIMFHNHNFFEMAYVCKGTCRNLRRGYEVMLSQGDLLLMNPRAVHCMCTDSTEDVVFNFLIPPDALDQGFISNLSNNSVSDFFMYYLQQLHTGEDFLIINAADDPLDELLRLMIREYYARQPGYIVALQTELCLAFVYMARRCIKSIQSISLQNSSKIARSLLLYIAENAATATLSNAAQVLSYSERHISRVLKKELKVSFTQLLQRQRLYTATQLLKKTTIPVKDVAMQVGYQNLSHFYELFQSKYNQTPADYRQSNSAVK